ncbi:unnamed protein product [Ambrosiozyma monospora]|uniref:Unnamed protein product n=1 Tax=Ambrosiozyma monospora TaxID=43982 RepID=A0ACB5TBF1_AMBMO|nr:unnamed protein product [Ambrosiozyma monospora]
MDGNILAEMLDCIPDLVSNEDFSIDKLALCLQLYWTKFHPQFPVLHHPSFSTHQAHPLLLLSMVMIGSACIRSESCTSGGVTLDNPAELSQAIAEPIRWLLLSGERACPPCKPWVIHSLVMLEIYEINRNSRRMHERGCIYNGTKIQLLRRSPFLCRDMTYNTHMHTRWDSWIETESMKRVAWSTFYIDTVQAIVYDHPVNLYANQLKLTLPANGNIWESEDLDLIASASPTPNLTHALRCILHKKPVKTNIFGQKILLAGLLNLILQVEQTRAQYSLLGTQYVEECNWQDVMSSKLRFWKSQLPGKSCCNLNPQSSNYAYPHTPSFLEGLVDRKCWFPEYHAAEIYLRLPSYDCLVYCGAPSRVNAKITPTDYQAVAQRMSKWSKTNQAAVCAVNCYIFLSEMLLHKNHNDEPQNDKDNKYNDDSHSGLSYNADNDPFFYRPKPKINNFISIFTTWIKNHTTEINNQHIINHRLQTN